MQQLINQNHNSMSYLVIVSLNKLYHQCVDRSLDKQIILKVCIYFQDHKFIPFRILTKINLLYLQYINPLNIVNQLIQAMVFILETQNQAFIRTMNL